MLERRARGISTTVKRQTCQTAGNATHPLIKPSHVVVEYFTRREKFVPVAFNQPILREMKLGNSMPFRWPMAAISSARRRAMVLLMFSVASSTEMVPLDLACWEVDMTGY